MVSNHVRWMEPGQGRRVVDMDSTAVLAFDDGARIPCDRYLLRCYSPLVRRVLDDTVCLSDHRSRTVVPLPLQASSPYWKAVDVLHGHADPRDMDLACVIATSRCMDFLDVTAFGRAMDARLWALMDDQPVEVVVEHAPRLLRNPALAPHVCKRLITMRITWEDFLRDVLEQLEAHADHDIVRTIVTYVPNFFPPVLVAAWALSACNDPTPDTALWIASQHGVMYHPCEAAPVMKQVRTLFRGRDWNPGVSGLADMAIASAETFDLAPWSEDKAHGTVIRYSDAQHVSACVTCPTGKLPRRMKIAEWMTLVTQRDGRIDVRFTPTHDDFDGVDGSLQLRIMCFDRPDIARAECTESWHCYSNMSLLLDDDEDYTLAHATRVEGDHEAVVGMVASKRVRRLRFDFFFREDSVLEDPFEEGKCEAYVSPFRAPA